MRTVPIGTSGTGVFTVECCKSNKPIALDLHLKCCIAGRNFKFRTTGRKKCRLSTQKATVNWSENQIVTSHGLEVSTCISFSAISKGCSHTVVAWFAKENVVVFCAKKVMAFGTVWLGIRATTSVLLESETLAFSLIFSFIGAADFWSVTSDVS